MTLKKSKSSSKKASKIAEYKNIQDDIFDYAGRYHFHQTITDMLYAVYKEKSEDPYTFMINFLIETKGCKFKNNDNQKMLKEIQEKDVEIKRLNDRIAYLEGLNNHQNTQGSQLIGTQTFLNNVSLATTLTGLTDISVSDLEKFAEDPSFLQGFESHLKLPPQMAITSEENPMISNSDISVPVPTNENPAERQNTNDLILSFNYSRLTKSEPPENSKMSLETISSNDTDEIAMEVSDSELFEKPVNFIVKAPERNVKSINNFDDFEPDYEPDDDE